MKNQKNQAIVLIITAGFFFALMTFLVRMAGEIPTMQKAFFRNAVAAVVSIIMLCRSKERFYIPKKSLSSLALRCICGTSGLICNFYVIDRLHISDANMLNKLSPFFAIIMSIFILKEKADGIEIGAVVLAFAGALFIMKPSFNMQFMYALIGALGGLGAGIAYTFVRKLGKQGVCGTIIVMCFSLFSSLVTLPFLIYQYVPMGTKAIACLLFAGASATIAQLSITAAYTKAPAKEISVFDYSQVVFAAILGMLFLDQYPDYLSIIGYVIIIGTAVAKWKYNLWKDKKEVRKEA